MAYVADFAAQPPELISGKIYAGPGAGPLLAAAAAWEALAAELQSSAATYGGVISGLTAEPWVGPSSEAFAAAAVPYVEWLWTTAAQADVSARNAQSAAAAYEAVYAAVVPPAVIALNRAELAELIPANVFGQYNTEISELESQYSEIWAQDVAAISSYASAASAATSELTQFSQAPATTSGSAAASPAADATITSVLQQVEAIWNLLFGKILSGLASDWSTFGAGVLNQVSGTATQATPLATVWNSLYSFTSTAGNYGTWTNVVNATAGLGIGQWKNFFIYQPWSANVARGALAGGLSIGGAPAARAASAVVGGAQAVGKLSVPPSWAAATPAIRLAATALPATDAAAQALPLSLLSDATLGSFTGGALGTPAARVVSSVGVSARPAPPKREAPVKLDRVIAHLQQQPDDVQHWTVDEAGLDDLVAELSTKPGIHAVHVVAKSEAVEPHAAAATANSK